MPTDLWRRQAAVPLRTLPNLAADYPHPNPHIIASWSPESIGCIGTSWVSSTYPAANRALLVPFVIAHPFLVRKVFWFNGTTATTDSADVGVYDDTFARLVSGGGTAISGASATQEVDVTDTLLKPGRYYMAYAQNGVTATPIMNVGGAVANILRLHGAVQMASAYVLPSTVTPAAVAGIGIPLFGIASRTLAS